MIKLRKPKRYANFIKISEEVIINKDISLFKHNVLKLKRVPKNTLKINFIRLDLGRDGNDFIMNRYTAMAEFELIRFKR